MRKYYLSLITILLFSVAKAQINIPATTLVSENYKSIGSSATAALPANWKMSSACTGVTSNWASGTNITASTQAASSVNPSVGGAYNWATTAGTDRALGFMTDGSYNSSSSIMSYYRLSKHYRLNCYALTISFVV